MFHSKQIQEASPTPIHSKIADRTAATGVHVTLNPETIGAWLVKGLS